MLLWLKTGQKVKGNFQDKLQSVPLCAFSDLKTNWFCAKHSFVPWLEVSQVKMWWHGLHPSIVQVLNINLGSCPTLYPALLAYKQVCLCLHMLQLHLTFILQIGATSVALILQGILHQFMNMCKQIPDCSQGDKLSVSSVLAPHDAAHTCHAALLPSLYL